MRELPLEVYRRRGLESRQEYRGFRFRPYSCQLETGRINQIEQSVKENDRFSSGFPPERELISRLSPLRILWAVPVEQRRK